jgi:serine protease Do
MKLWDKIAGKSAYWTLGLGVVVGLGSAAVIFESGAVSRANADITVHARPIAGISSESMAMLRDLDNSYKSLAAYIEPSVVHIRAESNSSRDLLGRRMGTIGGEGSGVIFRPDGWIVTNDHVVGGFDKVTVILNDGREFPGKVIRSEDRSIDVAVVKINATSLPAAEFGDSRAVKPGQIAIAVGSPFGFENSLTVGHISALGRQRVVGDVRLGDARVYNDFIQTDAPLNMGNSGGPLLNIEGQIVGINTAIYSGTGGSVGIGFAIPSNFARTAAETLIQKGKISRGYLGVLPENLKGYQLKEMNLSGGAIVAEAPNDGPAAMAGIRQNDVIVRIGTVPITSQQDLRAAMILYNPGVKVPVEFVRDGVKKTIDIKVEKLPAESAVPTTEQKGTKQLNPKEIFPDIPEMERNFVFPREDSGLDVPPLRNGQATLGVAIQNLSAASRSKYNIPANVKGALVVDVNSNSPADRLQIKPGDVITALGGKAVQTAADLTTAMKGVKWGSTRQIQVTRYSKNGVMSMNMPVTFR